MALKVEGRSEMGGDRSRSGPEQPQAPVSFSPSLPPSLHQSRQSWGLGHPRETDLPPQQWLPGGNGGLLVQTFPEMLETQLVLLFKCSQLLIFAMLCKN
uniref:Uncharacterized protein n=1 Tax=Pan paniscus TaxID=9597 RepID=A0A2R8ZK74_PANPA